MVTYYIEGEEYMDFATIVDEFDVVRSYTHKLLSESSIKIVKYRNRILYLKVDVLDMIRGRKMVSLIKTKDGISKIVDILTSDDSTIRNKKSDIENFKSIIDTLMVDLNKDYHDINLDKVSDSVLTLKQLQKRLKT